MRSAKTFTGFFSLRTLLLLCLLVTCLLEGQAERLPTRTYTIADGLARDTVNRIIQDSDGFLWFCTTEGLSRFDGYKFTTYRTDQGLPHFIVNDLLKSRNGVYWIATGGGVARFNPVASQSPAGSKPNGNKGQEGGRPASTSEPRFVVYRPGESEKTQFVNVLLEDRQGTIWCGTRGGLFRIELVNGQWVSEAVDIQFQGKSREDSIVTTIKEDEQGTLWVGAGSGLYRRWPNGQVERYTTEQGLPANNILSLLKDRQGRLWVGTVAGLCRLKSEPQMGQPVVERVYTTQDGLAGSDAIALFEASDGRLWVGMDSGLSVLVSTSNPDGESFHSYTDAQGLSDNRVKSLAEDRAGNLWLGTESGGAVKIARRGFITYGEADGLGDLDITSLILTRTGDLYAASGRLFLHQFDGKRFSRIGPQFPARVKDFGFGWYQTALQDHVGEWWIPTGEGLYRFAQVAKLEQLAQARPVAVYKMKDGLTGDGIFRLFEDSRGDMWISTFSPVPGQSGLTRWERSTGVFHRYTDVEGIGQAVPTAFGEDGAGNIWIGFYRGGLARYAAGRFTHFTATDGLPGGLIRAIYLDHAKRLWVGTGQTSQSGLCRIDDPNAERPRFTTYTTAQGLSSNDIQCITGDEWGHIYVGSALGVDRLDPVSGNVNHYTAADGLGNNVIKVALNDGHGGLWFGTFKGLSRLTPGPDPARLPPPVVINGLRIAGVTYPVSELGQIEVGRLELGSDQNQIQIDFLGLDFTPSETLRYQYRLEGADGDWSAPTDQRTVNYANLSPGTYLFVVRAMNAEGTYSQRPARIAFTIFPPFWQRWWFLTLCGVLIGLTVFAIDRYRAERVKELNAALSESKKLTENLKEQGAELQQVNRTLELEYMVTRILAESTTLHEAAPLLLRAICENVGWEIGAIWNVDSPAGVLRCVDVWHAPGLDAAEFEAMSREVVFESGKGLPGRVWQSGEPFWIIDLPAEANFPRFRVAAKEGLRSAFGFPILRGTEVLGIVEFYSHEAREPDSELLKMMSTIGSQIGQLIERKQIEEAMRESESRFRTLAETASDAIVTVDEESKILFVNPAAEKVFGYQVADLIGADLTMLMPEYLRHLHSAGLGRYVQTGQKHIAWDAVELPGLHKSGHEIPLELSFGEFSRNGKRYFTGIARDITERKRAEEALRRTKEERLIELERVRKRIATDLHDDIGSSLTQISILSEVARQRIGHNDAPVTEPLSMIATASRELVDSMSDIVWAINPQKDHLSDLQQRMRHFASNVFTARNIEFSFHAPGEEQDVQLGANMRREVFLIFKESINNMVKHSGCTQAEIEFRIEGDHLALMLHDNGQGFDVARESEGHGLLSMRERTKGLGGEFAIVSGNGHGTTVTLEVPIGHGTIASHH